MTIAILLYKVMGNRKLKFQFRFQCSGKTKNENKGSNSFSDGVSKRKTKLEV